MLTSVQIQGEPAVSPDTTWEPLKRLNCLFGENGSGKTTISRFLRRADPTELSWTDGKPKRILVYNRDLVDETILEPERMPGTFLLGETDVEAKTELDTLEGDEGEIAKAKNELAKRRSALSKSETAVNEASKILKNDAWKAREQFDKDLQRAWKGFLNSRQKFLDAIVRVHDEIDNSAPSYTSLNCIKARAETAFSESAVKAEKLSRIPHTDPNTLDGSDLLNKEVTGSKKVSISDLIETLGNRDWVAKGRSYLENSQGLCPFCQSRHPQSLADDLAAYFDGEYSQDRNRIYSLHSEYQQITFAAKEALDTAAQASEQFLDRAKFTAAQTKIVNIFADNIRKLEHKRDNPSSIVSVQSGREELTEVQALIDEANARIREHNALLDNQSSARNSLVYQVWEYFVRETIRTNLEHYDRVRAKDGQQIPIQQERVREQELEVQRLEERAQYLHSLARTDQAAIEHINDYLASVGFSNFVIKPAPEDGYYMLARDGGELISDQSLSEGERTFITFLHFFYRATGSDRATEDPEPTVLVIDDPISSLDSRIMWMVSQLVRRLMHMTCDHDSHLEQLLILSHNTRFYSEITFERQGRDRSKFPNRSSLTHAVLIKSTDKPSEFHTLTTSPVTSEYRMLWDHVRESSTGSSRADAGLQNAMRRILETYFKHIGGMSFHGLEENFPREAELDAYRSLIGWANEGSHDAPWESFDFVSTSASTEIFLTVFRRIFEETSNTGHYNMMMGLDR